MNQIQKTITEFNKHQNIGYSLIRIFLGIALFIRGWAIASNPDAVVELVRDENLHMWYSYITIGHLAGGLCLAVGVIPRIASLFQIPILIGAVVLSEKSLMMGAQSLELATLVLFLLVIYFIFGPGPWALSSYLNLKKGDRASGTPDLAA